MTIRRAPPGRTSISQTGLLKPCGPHHCATCLGSVHIWKTSSRGASKMRVRVTSRSIMAVVSSEMPRLEWRRAPVVVAAVLVDDRRRRQRRVRRIVEASEVDGVKRAEIGQMPLAERLDAAAAAEAMMDASAAELIRGETLLAAQQAK